MICKYFLTFGRLPFQFVDGFFFCTETLYVDVVLLVHFAFVTFAFGINSKKLSPRPESRLHTMFSSGSLMASGLKFKSLIHSELNFVDGIK